MPHPTKTIPTATLCLALAIAWAPPPVRAAPAAKPISPTWERAVANHIAQDQRRVFVHPATGAKVLNRPDLRAVVDGGGLVLVPQGTSVEEIGGWSLSITPTGLETATDGRSIPAGSASHENNRVVIDHPGLLRHVIENTPSAIEQRFVVLADMGADFDLRLAVTGPLTWTLGPTGLTASRDGRTVLTATPPEAFDARGAEVACRFERDGDDLLIRVRGARAYPILIDPAWEATGESQQGAWYGFSLAGAGDVNRDGHPDVVVAAPFFHTGNPSAGKIYLYYGSADGLATEPGWTSSGDNANRALFGWSVAATDVNADGYSDLIVGAPSRPDTGDRIGKAFVFLGSFNGPLPAAWTSSGDGLAGAFYGTAVAAAGDVDADGYGDVLVGAPAASLMEAPTGSPGKAFLYRGSAGGLLADPSWTASGEDQAGAGFGWSLAGMGDADGDGYGDVLVGAPLHDLGGADAGRVFLYRGQAGGLSAQAAWADSGDAQAGANYGWSVAGGPIDADGFTDALIGAPGHDTPNAGAGRTYAYRGGTPGSGLAQQYWWVATGSNRAGAQFGWSVALAGDVNADGYGDALVGAPGDGTAVVGGGRIFLYPGSPVGPAAEPSFTTSGDEQAQAGFGGAVAAAGDLDADTASDFLVGAYLTDAGDPDAGKAFVYLGTPGPGPGVCEPPGFPCDDGDDCTASDACDADGECHGTPFTCDDANPCTDDVCRPDGTCDFLHNTAPCDDGDPCTDNDTCAATNCSGTPKDCSYIDDGCQQGVCDPATGQCRPQTAPDGTPCDDGDPCTEDESCTGGVCVHWTITCKDGGSGGCGCNNTNEGTPCGPAAMLILLTLGSLSRSRSNSKRD